MRSVLCSSLLGIDGRKFIAVYKTMSLFQGLILHYMLGFLIVF